MTMRLIPRRASFVKEILSKADSGELTVICCRRQHIRQEGKNFYRYPEFAGADLRSLARNPLHAVFLPAQN